MSKTIFEPKAKTMSLPDEPGTKEVAVLKEKDAGPDSYESVPASRWKSMAGDPGYAMEGLAAASNLLGESLERSLADGCLGQNAQPGINTNPLALSVGTAGKNEYLEHFKPIEIPPSAVETISLFPDADGSSSLGDSITEAVAYYEEYLGYFNARKAVAEKALSGNNIAPHDAEILRQFLANLNGAIRYTNEQIEAVKDCEKGNVTES